MSSRNSRFVLANGTEGDGEEIQKIFEDAEFGGRLSVRFSRAPNPYRSLQNDGESVVLPVVRDAATGHIAGMGGCVLRTAFLNGAPAVTGYLTGMKLLKRYRGRMPLIRQAYELIAEQTRAQEPFYYSTILKSNEGAIRLLEKPRRECGARRKMPSYRYMGEYTVFCLGAGRTCKTDRKGGRVPEGFQKGSADGLADFYAEQLPKYNLAPKDERLYGLDASKFYTMRDGDGRITAACALWDQQSYKQYIITGYSGIYRLLRRLPARLFGYPALPEANAPANYASIALLAVRENDPDIARRFLRLVLADAGRYGFVMLGLFENHPLQSSLRAMRHIRYESRLYTVDFGDAPALDGRPIMLEVGLL